MKKLLALKKDDERFKSEGLAQAIAGWDTSASEGALFDNSCQLSSLIGRPTTPLSVVVADVLK